MNGFTSAGDFYSRPNPQAIGSPVLHDGGEFERTPELPRTPQTPPPYDRNYDGAPAEKFASTRYDAAGNDTFAPSVYRPGEEPRPAPVAVAPDNSKLALVAGIAFLAFLVFKDRGDF